MPKNRPKPPRWALPCELEDVTNGSDDSTDNLGLSMESSRVSTQRHRPLWNIPKDCGSVYGPPATSFGVPSQVPGRRQAAGLDRETGHRAMLASCLCIDAASLASLAESRDNVARRSWCTAAGAMRVPR